MHKKKRETWMYVSKAICCVCIHEGGESTARRNDKSVHSHVDFITIVIFCEI